MASKTSIGSVKIPLGLLRWTALKTDAKNDRESVDLCYSAFCLNRIFKKGLCLPFGWQTSIGSDKIPLGLLRWSALKTDAKNDRESVDLSYSAISLNRIFKKGLSLPFG